MSPQGISTSEPTSTAPLATPGQISPTDEFLLARMESFMSLAIVLASKCLAADGTDERSLVGVGAKMRPQIVGAGEALWT